jgi:hypothetical protein
MFKQTCFLILIIFNVNKMHGQLSSTTHTTGRVLIMGFTYLIVIVKFGRIEKINWSRYLMVMAKFEMIEKRLEVDALAFLSLIMLLYYHTSLFVDNK